MTQQRVPRVIIIGAGFSGLYAARELSNQLVDVLLIDRNNYHTFTPLLYQVATCGLDPSKIAYPIRTIFRKVRNVNILLGNVTAIDTHTQNVTVQTEDEVLHEPYDYLILAAGTTTNYFNQETIERYSFPMKTLEEAVALRNHILGQFERAARLTDTVSREALTTIVVVGGGATGLETAGAVYELYNNVLKHDYKGKTELRTRVILVEATDRVLAPYPERLRDSARQQLESLGVEVMLNTAVASLNSESVTLKDGRVIPTRTVVWAAGIKGNPLASMLAVPLERGARIPVTPQMQVIGLENVFAAGDITHLIDPSTQQPYAQVIQVANQQGALAARNILARIRGQAPRDFTLHDRGMMATIGRNRAVAYVYNRVPFTGFMAWMMWVFLHIVWLMGFVNRLGVFVSWVWNYITYDRAVRIILNRAPRNTPAPQPVAEETHMTQAQS